MARVASAPGASARGRRRGRTIASSSTVAPCVGCSPGAVPLPGSALNGGATIRRPRRGSPRPAAPVLARVRGIGKDADRRCEQRGAGGDPSAAPSRSAAYRAPGSTARWPGRAACCGVEVVGAEHGHEDHERRAAEPDSRGEERAPFAPRDDDHRTRHEQRAGEELEPLHQPPRSPTAQLVTAPRGSASERGAAGHVLPVGPVELPDDERQQPGADHGHPRERGQRRTATEGEQDRRLDGDREDREVVDAEGGRRRHRPPERPALALDRAQEVEAADRARECHGGVPVRLLRVVDEQRVDGHERGQRVPARADLQPAPDRVDDRYECDPAQRRGQAEGELALPAIRVHTHSAR